MRWYVVNRETIGGLLHRFVFNVFYYAGIKCQKYRSIYISIFIQDVEIIEYIFTLKIYINKFKSVCFSDIEKNKNTTLKKQIRKIGNIGIFFFSFYFVSTIDIVPLQKDEPLLYKECRESFPNSYLNYFLQHVIVMTSRDIATKTNAGGNIGSQQRISEDSRIVLSFYQ